MRLTLSLTLGLAAFAAAASGQTYPTVRPDGAALHSWLGVEYHEQRRLKEASREYASALALDPAALQHAHAFHIRYYYSALERQKLSPADAQNTLRIGVIVITPPTGR